MNRQMKQGTNDGRYAGRTLLAEGTVGAEALRGGKDVLGLFKEEQEGQCGPPDSLTRRWTVGEGRS